jgi:hypothetical protein
MPSDELLPAPPLDQIPVPWPNGTPYTHITAAIVVWNDQDRLRALLAHIRPFFETLAVVVQRSPDDTLEVAQEWADVVVQDEHRGFGDASFGPLLLPRVRTTWTLKVDADEWPTDELLFTLSSATWAAEQAGVEAVWIPFRSWVEENEWKQDHSHLRLFHTKRSWPPLLHSRPPIFKGLVWHTGHMLHKRTLDEMIQDYLRYWEVGRGTPTWDEHNSMMMEHACRGAAATKGWAWVKAFPWWPEVLAISFDGMDPEEA